MNIRRHKLVACANMRDIGGYQGLTVTKYNEFIRSDDISSCSKDEVEYIRKIGVKTIIDLRGNGETNSSPNVFSVTEGFKYFHIPLMREEKYGNVLQSFDLGEMYIDVIENKTMVKTLFTTIAENKDGVILYHCTAGKDRTGITTCLLLMLAGVDRYDIAADYQVSHTYLMPKIVEFARLYPSMPQHMFVSDPELIFRAYNHILEKYKSAFDYLLEAGVSKDNLEKIRRKLCTN